MKTSRLSMLLAIPILAMGLSAMASTATSDMHKKSPIPSTLEFHANIETPSAAMPSTPATPTLPSAPAEASVDPGGYTVAPTVHFDQPLSGETNASVIHSDHAMPREPDRNSVHFST